MNSKTSIQNADRGQTDKGKARRTAHACHQCRIHKNKCGGQRPTCSTCAGSGRICQYSSRHRKRGLPVGYVRAHEILCGAVIATTRGGEVALKALLKGLSVKNANRFRVQARACWRQSNLAEEILHALPVLESSTLFDQQNHKDDPEPAKPSGSISPPSNSRLPEVSPDREELEHFQCPPLPKGTRDWLEVFFSYTECWLPIIDRAELYRAVHICSTKKQSAMPHEVGIYAALWAVMALASRQCPQKPNMDENHQTEDNKDFGMIYATASRLVGIKNKTWELGHAQAHLILSLIEFGAGSWCSASISVGKAIRIALDLTYRSPTAVGEGNSPPPNWTMKRGQVIVACFVLDSLYSIWFRRAPQIRRELVLGVQEFNTNVLEEWSNWTPPTVASGRNPSLLIGQPSRAISVLNSLKNLMIIFHCAIDKITSRQDTYNILEEFSRHLSDWEKRSLSPFATEISGQSGYQSWLPQMYVLKIMSLTVKMAVHERCKDESQLGGVSVGLTYEQQESLPVEVLELLKKYSNDFGIESTPSILTLSSAIASSHHQSILSSCNGAERSRILNICFQLESFAFSVRGSYTMKHQSGVIQATSVVPEAQGIATVDYNAMAKAVPQEECCNINGPPREIAEPISSNQLGNYSHADVLDHAKHESPNQVHWSLNTPSASDTNSYLQDEGCQPISQNPAFLNPQWGFEGVSMVHELEDFEQAWS